MIWQVCVQLRSWPILQRRMSVDDLSLTNAVLAKTMHSVREEDANLENFGRKS